MNIDVENYRKEGLYLHFENGYFLDLSRERVLELAEDYWNDPKKLSLEIKEHEHFKTCSVCPYRGENVMCSALKPILPFLEEMEKFISCDRVNAIYVDKNHAAHVSSTSLQEALQYVTNMGVFEYCEDTKQYRPYFRGIMPLMSVNDSAALILLNMFWLSGGDKEKVLIKAKDISKAVLTTSRSCIQRIRLVCKSDAFINAYTCTHTLSEVFSRHMDRILNDYFKTPENSSKPTNDHS